MGASVKTRVLESLVREIVKGARSEAKSSLFDEARAHLSSVARLDYGVALRRHFDRAQLLEIIAELRRALPNLNRRIFASTDLGSLAKVAADFGARLQASRFQGREGRTLRGFYIDDGKFRKRPLICVNVVNHPAAVAAAFWHEVGHHLGRAILDSHGRHALSFTTDCHDHVTNLSETIADMVMVMGGYPHSAARRLFGDTRAQAVDYDVDLLVTRARAHVQTACGFDFPSHLSTHENLSYLASMIHVAKLRAGLFREFGV